ncbi:uncharacterized protein MELLADRAFT_50868 [Melampsora larici-populina 98AG31]|uniref:Glutaminase n=1 Tax=Melampsora larici-populina (strain 98AG31 / pathotype 3-4-7) TaxID=747676 RepID=F4S966_MELLP|nr:uncharacterized protein MELLADRAFT_50868 [Melampsora larici-populina 98AG31]EGF98815.1 hypothetical protein MELLADRAFT_50868 [Melampsora larici-populina 98AG31]
MVSQLSPSYPLLFHYQSDHHICGTLFSTDKDLSEMSPKFWTGSHIGWTGLIRVDGVVSNWMGNLTNWQAANNTEFLLTASSSNFTYQVANSTIELQVSFLSPITPNDLFRQSLPLSYLTISVKSLDGLPHQVELYTDFNGLWCTDSESEVIEWKDHSKLTQQTIEVYLRDQREYVESDDRILHGSVWYSTLGPQGSKITRSLGLDRDLTREIFSNTGELENTLNQTYRAIRSQHQNGTQDEPTFAFAHNLGKIKAQTSIEDRTVIYSIGHVREPLVQYMTKGDKIIGLQPLWKTRFNSPIDLVNFHIKDYHQSRTLSEAWDTQLDQDATRIESQDYADMLKISTRQIFMALEIVWDQDESMNRTGTDTMINGYRTMAMLKEISSNGNCQTTDVIAPMLPFLIYASPQLLTLLLEPIYRYISTGLYNPIPVPHDLGDHYPNATGRNDFVRATLPMEESGNFLSLALGCLRKESCIDQVQDYYYLLKRWADWLVENALYPDDQRSTDDFFGPSPNQTSLAVKGIIGLRAMSEISSTLGHKQDFIYYKDVAIKYVKAFLEISVSKDRTNLLGSYNNQSSWSTQYNLYLDKLYQLDLFPDWVYDMQDRWYLLKAGNQSTYGPPLDSRAPDRAKTDWLIWTSAASTLQETRKRLLDSVVRYLKQTNNNVFGDLITIEGGWSIGFLVRPVVGGHFALLAFAPPDLIPLRFKIRDFLRSEVWACGVGILAACFLVWRRCCMKIKRNDKIHHHHLGLHSNSHQDGIGILSGQKKNEGGNDDGDDESGIQLLRPGSYHQL